MATLSWDDFDDTAAEANDVFSVATADQLFPLEYGSQGGQHTFVAFRFHGGDDKEGGHQVVLRGVANGQQVVPGWWLDDIVEADTSSAWAKGDFAELFPGASYRSKWYQIDRGIGILCALGIHGQWIYIHPDAELVAIRLASEPIPLDPEYAKCWRRGFDAIADEFL